MTRPRWLTLTAGMLFVLLCAVSLLAYRDYRLQRDYKQLEWQVEVLDYNRQRSEVSLEVGTIQFLANGFSLAFDTVESTPAGAVLVGRFGNPKALDVSSLTLELEVDGPIWQFREAFDKDPMAFLFGVYNDTLAIGKAQVLVGDVPAGTTAPFRIVVPNVKDHPLGQTALVTLRGERYSYLR